MSSLQQRMKEIAKKFDYRKTTEFEGTKFELALLTLQEEKKMNAAMTTEAEGLEYFQEMRKIVLSHSLRKIDDAEIPEIIEVEDEKGKSTKERAIYVKEFFDSLPNTVTEHLFNVYLDLKEEAEEKYKKGIKYEWFKTPEQRDKETEERIKEEARKEAELKKISGEATEKEEATSDISLRPIKDDREDEEKPKTE